MSDSIATLIAAGAAFVVGLLIERVRLGAAYRDRDQILKEAGKDAAALRKDGERDAEKAVLARQKEVEREAADAKEALRDRERQTDRREAALEEATAALDKRDAMVEDNQRKLADRLAAVETREAELDRVLAEEREELLRISGLSKDEAAERLLTKLDGELASEAGGRILKHEADLREREDELAVEIVGMAVQRLAGEHVNQTTTTTVDIPNDEVKGRIIGREGRNIRTFEEKTGVDVIVDDTPGVVVVSCFDTVRREVARRTLEKLVKDGRIHPSRIEELFAETQGEMDEEIVRRGKEAVQEVDVPKPHPEVLKLLGRLHYRRSYSQNVLSHSIEVARLTALMADQLGLDAALARRCGFYHDLGKAADHEMEGGHPKIGADILKRYREPKEVVHAALGHHDDIRPAYPYTVLVAAADAVSAARPGARRESLDRYVRRLEELEALALGFPGVEQCYAVQAGREVRVIVDPESVDDRGAAKMARDIAKAVEDAMTYPGEVKVTVLRETRATGVAR